MPDVTMPNGDLVAFPDDMPKEQIRSLIIKKFPDADKTATAQNEGGVKGFVDRAAKDVVQGVASMADIPGSLASIVPDAMTAAARHLGHPEVKDMEPLPRLSTIVGKGYDELTGGSTPQAKSIGGRIFDAALQTASGGVTGGARTATEIARTAIAGATGQGAAEAVNEVDPGNKVAQDAAMLAGSAAGVTAAHGVGKAGAKIINAKNEVLPEHYQQLKDAADNIDPSGKLWDSLSVGQVTQNKLAQKVEAGMQLVPSILGGTGKQVKNLQEMTNTAAKDFTAQQFDKVINTNFKNYNQIADAAADEAHPLHGQAIGALKILDSAGEDAGNIMQASKKASDFRNEFISAKQYALRDQLIEKAGGAVKLDKTRAAIQDGMDELSKINTPETDSTLKYLSDYTSRLPLDEGVPYINLRDKGTVLSDKIGSLKNGDSVDRTGARILAKIADAQKSDMTDYIGNLNNPRIKAAVEKADNFYKNKIVPQRAEYFNKLGNTDPGNLPDQVYSSLVKAGNHGADTAQAFYNNLEPKGRASVRYSMVDEAVQKAMDAKGNVSPDAVSNYLHDIRQARGVFFKGQDKWELDGFSNLMNHMKIGYKPNSIITAGAGGAEAYLLHTLGWTGGASTLASAYALRWLLTSPRGKAFMLASSSLKPGTPAMGSLMEKIAAQMKVEAGQVGQNKNP